MDPPTLHPQTEPFWAEADDCLIKLEFDNALAIYRNALISLPNDVRIIDAMGSVMMQQGNFTEATHLYKISISLAPDIGYEKYLNLAELATGKQALQLYEKGLNLLVPIREKTSDPALFRDLTEQLVGGLCAVAEIYMGDECFESNAESMCQHVLTEALKYDPNSAEALQVMASFKISQQNNPEALQFLERSYEIWRKLDDTHECFPSFEFRVSTAKLFLELDKNEISNKILHKLLAEDDEIAELWFLQGETLIFRTNLTQL